MFFNIKLFENMITSTQKRLQNGDIMIKHIVNKIVAKGCAVILAAVTVGTTAFAGISLSGTGDFASISGLNVVYGAPADTSSASSVDENGWPVAPEIVSGSAILIDADTGAILYDKDSHAISYPASTTKILTGLLTIENCSMDEIVTFSKEAANSVTWEDAQLGSKAGEEMTVEQVMYGMLLHSANEMAYALAEHVSGSLSAFTEMMNERAKELGALNTHFTNASGLHDLNHYTTAYDMAMIARGCYNNPKFVDIDSTYTTYTIPPTNKTTTARTFKHRHLMLKGRQYEYEYCKGGKTGFTDEAGCTLVTFAEKDDMRLICVCFKSDTNQRFIDTRNLFDWGFANFKKITTSGGDLSSLLTSDSYYDSRVFNQYNLDLNLNAATLTLPKDMSVGDVKIDLDNNYNPTSNNGIYTAKLNYTAKNNVVGMATLRISTPADLAASNNLPYLTEASSKAPSARKCVVINMWYLIIGILVILLIYYILSSVKESMRRRRRRARARRRKLRM